MPPNVQYLNYESGMPLTGLTVLITRTHEGNQVERDELEKLGAKVVECNTIQIAPPSSTAQLDQAISLLSQFQWVLLTSATGVRLFFQRFVELYSRPLLEELKRNSSQPRFACIGPSTRAALEQLGFKASFEPTRFLTRALGQELAGAFKLKGQKVLLARAEEANPELAKILKKAGAEVWEVAVYATLTKESSLSDAVLNELTDITFASPSAVKAFVKSVPVAKLEAKAIRVHCIGPVTAEAAKQNGLRVDSIASIHTIQGLVESLVRTSLKANGK